MKRFLFLCLVCAWPLPGWAAESEEAQRRRLLDEKCEQARAAQLRPVQQKKIEECVRQPPKDRAEKMSRADCEAYWKDYGWGSMTGEGTRNPNLYADIPECRAAFEASKEGARR